MTASSWAQLRQVVLATDDIERDGALLRSELGVGVGFGDPALDEEGMLDETIPVGPESYLELVAAARPDHPIVGFLERRGGPTGYCLSIQHPDPRAAAVRAGELGVRVTNTIEEFMGAHIVQMHPADCGILLELDGIVDREKWFWDGRDDQLPTPDDASVNDVIGVEVSVADPAAMAQTWKTIMDVGGTEDTVDLSGRTVRFVPIGEDGRKGLTAVELQAAAGAETGTRRLVGVDVTLS